MNRGMSWRVVFTTSGTAYACVFVLLIFTKFAAPRGKTPDDENKKSGRKMPRYGLLIRPVFLCLLVSIVIYVAVETACGFFMDYLFTESLNAPNFSAAAISVFWISMMLSRFIAGFLGKGEKIITPAAFLVISFFAILIAAAKNPAFALVCCFMIGFAHGPVWPNIVGLASREYPSETGLITGSMTAASGIGGALSPVLMGIWADRFGIGAAFIIFAFITAAGFLTMTGYLRLKKSRRV